MDRTTEEQEDILNDIIAGGGDDDFSSQFLNDSGEGMELERRDEGQTNNDDEENVGPLTKSSEVY